MKVQYKVKHLMDLQAVSAAESVRLSAFNQSSFSAAAAAWFNNQLLSVSITKYITQRGE